MGSVSIPVELLYPLLRKLKILEWYIGRTPGVGSFELMNWTTVCHYDIWYPPPILLRIVQCVLFVFTFSCLWWQLWSTWGRCTNDQAPLRFEIQGSLKQITLKRCNAIYYQQHSVAIIRNMWSFVLLCKTLNTLYLYIKFPDTSETLKDFRQFSNFSSCYILNWTADFVFYRRTSEQWQFVQVLDRLEYLLVCVI